LRPWVEGVLFIQKRISIGDYSSDGDHDERPTKRRTRADEGRVNGASGRTRSAGFRRLSLPVRRPPPLPHRKRGSGSPRVRPLFPLRSPFLPRRHSPFLLPTRSPLAGPTVGSLIKISILIVRRPPSRADVLAGA
jgi:hypothetical protein